MDFSKPIWVKVPDQVRVPVHIDDGDGCRRWIMLEKNTLMKIPLLKRISDYGNQKDFEFINWYWMKRFNSSNFYSLSVTNRAEAMDRSFNDLEYSTEVFRSVIWPRYNQNALLSE